MTTELECGNYKPHRRDAHQNPEADYANRKRHHDRYGNEVLDQCPLLRSKALSNGVYHFPGPRQHMPDTLPMLHSRREGTKMSRRFLLVLSLSFVISALAPLSLKAQTGPVHWKDNRVPFRLLPGYKITGSAGFEGDLRGKIWRDDGPTIRYDIDLDVADDAGSTPKEQQL
jgi:hypothetical protein